MHIGETPDPSSIRVRRVAVKVTRQARPAAAPQPVEAASVHVSASAKQLQKVEDLLRQTSLPRPEAVARARELLANWEAPGNADIDKILDRLFQEEA